MKIRDALKDALAEAPYLRSHYAKGDTSVVSWLAGWGIAKVRLAQATPPPLAEAQQEAEALLKEAP